MTVVIPLNDFLTESNEAEYNIFLLMRAVSGHQQTRNTRVLKKSETMIATTSNQLTFSYPICPIPEFYSSDNVGLILPTKKVRQISGISTNFRYSENSANFSYKEPFKNSESCPASCTKKVGQFFFGFFKKNW